MTKPASDTKKRIVRRVVFIYILALLFSIGIVAQAFNLIVFQHEKWKTTKESPIQLKETEAKRGDILSSDGNLLATSVPWYEVVIDLRMSGWDHVFTSKKDSVRRTLDTLVRGISKFVYLPPEKVLADLRKLHAKGSQFEFKRQFIYKEYMELKKLPILRSGQFVGGLRNIQHSKRVLPYSDLAKRSIGELNEDGRGLYGFEKAYNEYLKGEPGEALMQKIGGNIWMPVDEGAAKEPVDGYNVVTTLDMNFQDIVHNALLQQLKKTDSHHGCAVLMDVETGEVLAISNLVKDKYGYEEDYNYAVGERTEPGSTMKLASFMAGIEDGYLHLDDTINTGKGSFVYKGLPITDTEEEGHGKLSIKDIFKVSSNVGVVKAILKHYEDRPSEFIDRLYTFNLNKKLGLGIPGEPPPIIKYPGDSLWWAGSLAQISYGYETKFTAMQILAFYNAVANDGKMVRPRFKKYLKKDGKIVKRFSTEVIDNSICSRSTLRKARELLECVVEDGYVTDKDGHRHAEGRRGTAWNIKSPIYKIAGKTGTAQIADEDRGYKVKKYQASFVGYFPADEPKYSCIVVINSPNYKTYYGNLVAGPVFKEISDKVYARTFALNEEDAKATSRQMLPVSMNGNYKETIEVMDELDLPVDESGVNSEWVLTLKHDSIIEYQNRFIREKNLMPNVKGMGLKDALYILENLGLKVEVSGYGMIHHQTPQPNSRIKKGQRVILGLKTI
ncbi:MAG: transpeptidase family protein [Bacteroidales bacterium]|nr:transpeptidase family protein [Bacteroidales bacterium]MCF8454329.1 transpeptidase family protein [Bacteroidales bacterium]